MVLALLQTTVSNYAGNLALKTLLRQSGLYLALHEADPTVVGDLGTEVAGGGYGRQPMSFANPSGKAAVSARKAYFAGMPASIVAWFGIWDDPSVGNFIVALRLGTPVTVADGQQFQVEIGDFAFQL